MDFIKVVKINIKTIFKNTVLLTNCIFSILAIILSFITWEELGVNKIQNRINILVGIILISIILSIIYISLLKKTNTIWQNGGRKITLCYGDIMKVAFPRRNKKNRIVVIPVNTSFDTIVDEDITSVDKPLISPISLHGQWIKRILKSSKTLEQLDKDIEEQFNNKNIIPTHNLSPQEKSRGKTSCYKRGTVISIKGENNIIYFLFALSEFDSANNAQCSKEELYESIESLLDYYNKHSQGYELFVPLMGTNLSRVGISHQESINILKNIFVLHSDKINGAVNIIAYNKDKDKVSICN